MVANMGTAEEPITSDATPTIAWGPSTDASGIWKYQYSLDGPTWIDTFEPWTALSPGDGRHTLAVRAVDNAGNTSNPATTYVFRIDTTAPPPPSGLAVSEDTGAADDDLITSDTTLQLHWTPPADAGGIDRYEYRLDQADWTSTMEPVADLSLPEGSHLVHIRAIDRAGNIGQELSRTVSVDLSGPRVSSYSTGSLLDHIDLIFDADIDASSFTPDDVALVHTASAMSVPITGIQHLSQDTWRVRFDPLEANGVYDLTVGPNIADLAGNDMNRNAPGAFAASLATSSSDMQVIDIVAPADATPGLPFELSWTVINTGEVSVSGDWTTEIYISRDATIGEDHLLAVVESSGMIIAESPFGLRESVSLTFPEYGFSGENRFVVRTNAKGEVPENNSANNAAISDGILLTPNELTLQPSATTIAEDAADTLRMVLSRSGNRDDDLAVVLHNSDPSELVVPESVIIPAGHSAVAFLISPIDDGVVDHHQAVTLTASADGVTGDSVTVTVTDAQKPALSLTLGADTVTEGAVDGSQETILTVTRDPVDATVVSVELAVSRDGQVDAPLTVEIPANVASVEIPLRARNDQIAEMEQTVSITARADGHAPASADLTVVDDDAPTISLELSRLTVSEGDGATALTGTVRREEASDTPLSVGLSASHPARAIVPAEIIISAGRDSATFYIAIVDDAMVGPAQPITITASAILPACDCDVPATGEEVSAVFDVLDDDGPALTVAFDREMVGEGLADAAVVTVTRNTQTDEPLTVTLASSDTTELTVPTTITIDAGQSAVSATVQTVADGIADGTMAVTVTATAEGFTLGSDQIAVSDVDLPDLVVGDVSQPDTVLTETYFDVTFRVENTGLSEAVSTNADPDTGFVGSWVDRVFLSDDPYIGGDVLIGEYAFTGAMPHTSGLNHFERTVPIRVPRRAGDYWIVVETDTSDTVREGVETNNARISAEPIAIQAAYQAEVATDIDVAPAGTPIPLSGRCVTTDTLLPVPFAPVNIHINTRGFERVIAAIADETGQFSTTWLPLPDETGHYTIGAVHPGSDAAAVQDSFDLMGVEAEPARQLLEIVEGETASAEFVLRNLSDPPLTDLTVSLIGKPDNLEATIELSGNVVDGLDAQSLSLTVHALDASVPWTVMTIRVTSAEAAPKEIPVAVSVLPLRSDIEVYPGSLVAGMPRGEQTLVEFAVTNTGGKETGPIEVALPDIDWMSTITTVPLASLGPNESTVVTLLLTPPADMAMTDFEGSLLVQAADTYADVPFSFRAVSEATGDLVVSVVDEFFYYTEEAPKLSGATVQVIDAISGGVAAEDVTTELGTVAFAGLREGYYDIEVRAADHDSYTATIFVEPNQTNSLIAYLPRETVKYVWAVTETEIEDRYEITVESVFETNVPAPVVTIDPPMIDLEPLTAAGQTMQVDMTIENHGLIAAHGANLEFGDHPMYTFTPLIEEIGDVPALSSLTVPVIVERLPNTPSAKSAKASVSSGASSALAEPTGPCSIPGRFEYYWVCAGDQWVRTPIFVTGIDSACESQPFPTIPEPYIWPPVDPEDRDRWDRGTPKPPGGDAWPTPDGPIIRHRDPSPPYVRRVPVETKSDYCGDCAETELGLEFCFGGGFLEKIAVSAADKILKTVPWLDIDEDDVELNICTEVGAARCCDEGQATGEWHAATSVTGEFSVEVFIGPEGEVEIPGIDVPGLGEVDLELEAGFGAKITLTGIIGAGLEGGCGDDPMAGWLKAELELDVAVGPQGEAEVKFGNREYEAELFVGLTSGGRLTAEWRTDTGWNVYGCVEDLAVAGRLEFEYEGDTLGGSVSHPLVKGNCAEEGNTEGNHALGDPIDAVSLEAWAMADGDPVAGPADFMMTPDALASALQYYSREEMEQLLGVSLGDKVSMSELDHVLSLHALREQPADGGICAQVKLQLKQEAVITRDAFEAQLELENGTDNPLGNVVVDVVITDATGLDVTDLFSIRPPELSGFVPNGDSFGSVAGKETGIAGWLIVPTTECADDGPEVYYVGGTLSYTERGLDVTLPMTAVPITVYPQAELHLRYFHQRDVFSDDPWTDEIEPAQPFELAVLVENRGAGDARSLRIESAQPEIIENEKGLLIDFQIIATEVAGQNMVPSLTADFGDVTAGSSEVGRWWMTSSLQGQFIEYEADFVHIDGLGDPRLSLIKSVDIHELIHTVDAAAMSSDGMPDFLVNDLPDLYDYPDTLYLSDGRVMDVALAANAILDGSVGAENRQVQLTVDGTVGWNYLRTADPGGDHYRLARVLRHHTDGSTPELLADNFWQTDRTFAASQRRPIDENNLHLFDHNPAAGSHVYTLIYEPRDQDGPVVTTLPLFADAPQTEPVASIEIEFSEPIVPESFTRDDLALSYQGGPDTITDAVTVTPLDESNTRYLIDGLGGLNQEPGEYALIVRSEGVQDIFGNPGTGTRSTSWIRVGSTPAVMSVTGIPNGTTNEIAQSVVITFSEPIDPGTLTASDVILSRDGGANLLTDPLDLVQAGDRSYQVRGLDAAAALEGEYTLTILAEGVEDLDGNAGVGTSESAWTLDVTAPNVTEMRGVESGTRNKPVFRVLLETSETLDVDGLSNNALTLLRDGANVSLGGDVTIRHDAPHEYRVDGLYGYTSPDGHYELIVDATFFHDPAGNAGTGSVSLSWIMDSTAPTAAAGMRIMPDSGVDGNDGITNSSTFTLSGHLGDPDVLVEVFDDTSGEALGLAETTDLTFSKEIAFTSPGHHRLLVRLTDGAGNHVDSFFDVFVDLISPMVEEIRTPSGVIDVEFSERMGVAPMILDGSIVGAFTLTKIDTGPVALEAERFSYDAASRVLSISTVGLGAETPYLDEGNYQLEIDGSQLPDVAGNLLRGGSGGIVQFDFPAFDPAENIQANGSDIQVANYSVPSVADWNSDGVPDLIVGEKTATGQGKVRVYLNSGTRTAPVYDTHFHAMSEGAELALPGAGCLGVFPRVFDWDGDGRKDLVVGRADGRVQVLLNTNTDDDPRFGPAAFVQVGPFGSKSDIDVGYRATLDIVDYNSDGRYDLVLGAMDGKVRVLLNEAASGPADFTAVQLVANGVGGDLTVTGGRSSVDVVDLNGDGRKDLVLGNTNGQLLFYANTGTDAAPTFGGFEPLRSDGTAIDLPGTPRSRQFVDDIDGDGVVDLLVGAHDGLVRLYRGLPDTTVGEGVSVNDGEPGGTYTYAFNISYHPGDFDYDGNLDVDDLDALTAVGNLALGVAVPPAQARFDLNGDGTVNTTDLDQWLADAARSNGFGSPYLRGDANLDGDVDVWAFDGSGDAQIFSSNLGTASGAVWSQGDFNGDGDIDVWAIDASGDAQLLSENLGKVLGSIAKAGGTPPTAPTGHTEPQQVRHATIVSESAVDLALTEDQADGDPLSAALDWQYEFESTQTKAAKRKDVEATVDLLLATDWA